MTNRTIPSWLQATLLAALLLIILGVWLGMALAYRVFVDGAR
jgi:hypothetical protein